MSSVTADNNRLVVWKESRLIWLTFACLAGLLGFIYYEGLSELVRIWGIREEYSHGYLIPFITLFLIWQRKDLLERISFNGSWAGLVLVVLGLALFMLGNLSTLFLIVQYSFLVVILGLGLSYCGLRGFKIIAVPLLFLAFMIPLPSFFLTEISTRLQFISSEIGVWVIRLFGISVYLEGNVIDLGSMKLQVVEACSGLRYLFPLMTLGFIAAYFFKTAFWKRAFVFLSTIPLTVLMNSFRIGMIGVMVEYWGKDMAEGFLHDFEGWAVFMACTAVLVGEMWLLSRTGKERLPLRVAFGLDIPAPTSQDATIRYRTLSRPFLVTALIVMLVAVVSAVLPERVELQPKRSDFTAFPLEFGHWKGKGDRLEQVILTELKLDDYIIADYADGNMPAVNFYVAYYASQRKGESAHSPRTCIPGGGWDMTSLTQHVVDGVNVGKVPLSVNRAVIQKGDYKQLVYYWFQQRGRIITNEYLVKWYLFWDALTRNRTDGALIRLTTQVHPDENITDADQRLVDFAKTIGPQLKDYIPE
jgi:exosortase D (VPLPA-CTERM-specific)